MWQRSLLFVLALVVAKGALSFAQGGAGDLSAYYRGSHALLIGIENYRHGSWQRLESIPGELEMIKTALVAQGFSVEVKRDLNLDGLKRAMDNFINSYGLSIDNRLLFYFAGHGHTRKIKHPDGSTILKGYFVASDAPDPLINKQGFLKEALDMNDVLTFARKIESKHALFLFDSCFSGTVFKVRSTPEPEALTRGSLFPTRQFITAGSADEEVPADSLFARIFVRGLKGAANLYKDDFITADEMGIYIKNELPKYDRKVHPQYGKLRDPSYDEGDLVLSKLRRQSGEIPEASRRPDPERLRKMAQDWYELGRSLWNGDAYDPAKQAVEYFDHAITLDPNYALAYNNRGIAYYDLKQYRRAIEDYDQVIRLDPKLALAYSNRGIAYGKLNQYQRAIRDYDRAIGVNPKYFRAYVNRGIAYRNLRQYQRAIKDYDEAIRLNPKYAVAYNSRGIAYRYLKQYQRAIQDYDEAIRLDPKYFLAYNNRGNAYRYLKQYQRAIQDYDHAIRLNPKYALAFKNRGNARDDLKQYQRAIQDFDQAIRLNPNYLDAYILRGIAYRKLKQYQRAIEDYDRAIRLNPKYALAYNNRGIAYRYLKQFQRAIQDYDHAIRLNPKYALAYNNRGVAYRNLKQYQRAIQDYDQAIRLDPKYVTAYLNRGNGYFNLKQYQQAIQDYDQAIRHDPNYAIAHGNRGLAREKLGQMGAACGDWRKACELGHKSSCSRVAKKC